MDTKTMAARIVELCETVQYHADRYYNKAQSEITDAEYDALVDELKTQVAELERKNPSATEIAQGKEVLNNVGSVPSYGRKVTHSQMMGSLDKATKVSEIVAWYHKYAPKGGKIVVMPKIDGCFRYDSKVMMANGEERSIFEIKEGMSVLTVNEKTGKTESKKVLSILVRKADKSTWLRLVFDGGREIICTRDHLFLTSNRGWVQAQDLTEVDQFVEPSFSS